MQDSTESGGSAAIAQTPKDMLVMAKNIVFEFTGIEIVANVYDRVMTFDPDNLTKLVGGVVESWEIAEDGKTITFQLRPGQKFHSGNPVTTEDVAFSLQRVIKLNKTPSFIFTQFGWTADNVDDDELGRDIYDRIVWGSRVTLRIVALVGIIVVPIGLVIGTVAGFLGGWIDNLLMRITDIFLAFPRLILALALVAALGPGLENAALAIAMTTWAPYARIARAETLTIRNSEFVQAAKAQGASSARLLTYHIVPLCLSSVIIRLTLDMAGIILTAAGLGFLGLGAQPPLPEWGAMIATGRQYILDQWWVPTVPGLTILIVSMGFNLLGDGLRDVLDPKSTGR